VQTENQQDDQTLVPGYVIDAVMAKKCIVFLGAAANAPSPEGSVFNYKRTPPVGNFLSTELAKHIKHFQGDPTNLPRVSLALEVMGEGGRENLINIIKQYVAARDIVPSPILHMLAALPFPIYITTNYDTLLERALNRAQILKKNQKTIPGDNHTSIEKVPIVRIYESNREKPPEPVPLDIEEENPVVFKLHGDINTPASIVVTEEDYLTFILKMTLTNHLHPIPTNIRARLNDWPTLFIGYSLRDYNLRLLLRTLRFNVDPANYKPFFSVDCSPDEVIVSVFRSRGELKVQFISADVWKFVPKLYELCCGIPF
jgi:hypothetical protein